MTETQRGHRYALTLSGLAAIYGAILAARLLSFQPDIISDVIKFSGLVFILTLVVSSFWWVVIRRYLRGWKSGAGVGFMTAITIIPLPTFAGSLKAQVSEGVQFMASITPALHYSWSTLSLAEFLAIPGSILVGLWAVRDEL